jgi:putative nucleotidyltransferase with HDIG domain
VLADSAHLDDSILAVEPRGIALPVTEEWLDRIAYAFAAVIDAKTPYTARHSTNVARYAVAILRSLGGDADECRDALRAGLLHDVGKLESNLSVFARVLATIVGERGSRFAKYHAHEKIGAQMLRQAGSDEETWQLVAGEVSDSPQLQTVLAALQQADEI